MLIFYDFSVFLLLIVDKDGIYLYILAGMLSLCSIGVQSCRYRLWCGSCRCHCQWCRGRRYTRQIGIYDMKFDMHKRIIPTCHLGLCKARSKLVKLHIAIIPGPGIRGALTLVLLFIMSR